MRRGSFAAATGGDFFTASNASRFGRMSHYTRRPRETIPCATERGGWPVLPSEDEIQPRLHVSRAFLLLLVLLPGAARPADIIGAETCKSCHPLAYEAWRYGPHARGAESLPEASRKDLRCLSCHAPDADKGLAGVSCERCHGAGRLYSQPFVMRDRELARAVGLVDPGEKTCAECHTDSTPSLGRFEYARKLPLIQHGGDRAARKNAARPARSGDVRAPAGR